jgi:hypothetical protein
MSANWIILVLLMHEVCAKAQHDLTEDVNTRISKRRSNSFRTSRSKSIDFRQQQKNVNSLLARAGSLIDNVNKQD